MKDTITIHRFICKIMRITAYQLLLCILFAGISYADNTYAQELLERKVSVHFEKMSIEKVISALEKQAKVKFVYSHSTLKQIQKIDLQASNENLRDVLNQLLSNTSVKYVVKNNTHIVLKMVPDSKFINELMLDNESEIIDKTPSQVITGTVKTSDGSELPGVNVVIKGSQKGTSTDANGKYTIEANPDDILVFSFIGYDNYEIKVGNQTTIDAVLNENLNTLNEVTVTALGIEKDKREVGYATAKVTSKEILASSPTNFASVLYGKVPGVTINTNAGGATSGVSIQVRGIASLNQQKQPLLVVDGAVIRNNDSNDAFDNGNQRLNGNGLLDINPENIESVNILKGAAAAALYGSDATFGVILVTTKNGKGVKKGFGVDVNFSANQEAVALVPDFQTEYGPGYDRSTNMGNYGADDQGWIHKTVNGQSVEYPAFRAYGQFGPKYDGRQVYFWDGQLRPYEGHPDSYKKSYRKGHSIVSNIAINHQNDKMSYRLSYTRNDYQGIQVGGQQQKNTFNFNSTYNFNSKISVDFVANYINEKVHNRPRQISQYTDSYDGFISPSTDVNLLLNQYQTTKGYKYVPSGSSNLDPVEAFKYNIRGYSYLDFLWSQLANSYDETSNRFMPSVTLKYNSIVKGLNFRGRIATDYTGYNLEEKDRSTQPISFGASGLYNTNNSSSTYTYGDVLISYENKLNDDMKLTASVGYQARKEAYKSIFSATNGGLSTENWFSISASTGTANTSSTRGSLIKDGLFGILNFNFKDFWFVEGTFRRERTSSIYFDHNVFYYPGVSSAFELSRAFNLPSFVDYSKLRGAYALVGNPPNRYYPNVVYTGNSVQGIPYFTPNQDPYGNNSLKNETKGELEIGWETRFLDDRIGFDISFYNSRIQNQIMTLSTPATIGSTSVAVNAGTFNNRGLEVSLYGTPVKIDNFRWDVRLNYAVNKNKVVSLADGLNQILYTNIDNNSVQIVARPGEAAGEILGYKRRTDDKGNYVITDGTNGGYYDINFDKQVSLGNIQPKGSGGVINTVTYKDLSLNFQIDFRYGGYAVSKSYLYAAGAGMFKNSLAGRDTEHGGLSYYVDGSGTYVASNGPGPNGETVYHDGMILQGVKSNGEKNDKLIDSPSFYENTYSWGSWPGSGSVSTYEGAVFKNDFIKMREISLSYALPVKLKSKIAAQKLVLSLYGRNLFYIYKTLPSYDPEGGVGTRWVDQATSIGSANAPTRSYGASLRMSF